MSLSTSNTNNTIFMKCLAGGIGCGISGFITNPMDVIKIKNQQYGGKRFGTFLGTAQVLITQEGVRGFLKGASASVLREMTYSSLRMGLYEPIKDVLSIVTTTTTTTADRHHSSSSHDVVKDSPFIKWTSSFLSGAIGAAIFNPVDLVKVRFQSQLPGQPKPYPSLASAFVTIYKQEQGFTGLYNGTTPTVIRAAFLTCAQLGTYDIIKNNILCQQFHLDHEKISTHFIAALISSVVTTTAANPADVVKTRVMNDSSSSSSSSSSKGNKTWVHFQNIIQKEGITAFMKGWTASYLRIGPHTVISFLLIERVRQFMGMTTY